MTSAGCENFYISDYDLEMHSGNPEDLFRKSIERLGEAIQELEDCEDPNVRALVILDVRAKLRDCKAAFNRLVYTMH